MTALEALGTLRHACLRCGGICQGKVVHLHVDEVPRTRGQAQALGIEDPVQDGRLRQVGGRCVFLDDDQLCRIHSRWGAEAKPAVCQQAPVVALRTEAGVRVGVDPGCLQTWQTWRDGPDLPAARLVATTVPLAEGLAPLEAAVVDMLDGATIAGALAALAGVPATADLPPGFALRLCDRLRQLDLAGKLAHPDSAPALRSALSHVAETLPGIEPGPWPVLLPQAERFAVEVTRRVVYLRLVDGLGHPPAVAVLLLCGAVACAWADPAIEHFGPAMSAWSRLVRAPANVAALLPSAGSLAELLGGRR